MANEPRGVSFGSGTPVPRDDGTEKAGQAFENSLQGQTYKTIKVKSGDTLHRIAARNNLDIAALLAANTQFDAGSVDGKHNWSRKAHGKRDADDLRLGETIRIPVATVDTKASGTAVPASLSTRNVRINEAPSRGSAASGKGSPQPANVPTPQASTNSVSQTGVEPQPTAVVQPSTVTPTKEAVQQPVTAVGELAAKVPDPKTPDPKAPDPKTPDPAVKPPEYTKKDFGHQMILLTGGSGSKDPRSADNRALLIIESLDSGTNPNTGTYQFSSSLAMPGRVQEPQARLDATARMTLFSLGRKPLTYQDADGKDQSIETFGVKMGGMKAENRFASVSVMANVSGMSVGAIQQPNGTAVDGKSPTSPLHLGVGASIGHIDGFFAWGVGNGAVHDVATDKVNTTHTSIYGLDMAVPFNFKTDKSKVYLDRAHFGITGRRTVTTPEGGQPGKAAFANSAFLETFFKVKTTPLTSLLPGQPASEKLDNYGIFRMRIDTPMAGKIDPRVTLRYDQPLWAVRNLQPGADGKLTVKTQFQLEAIGMAQFGLNSQHDPAVQNFMVGLRARF